MIRRGTLQAFDDSGYLASVQLDGSLARNLTDIPVSRAIADTEMDVGRRVAIAFLDPDNPRDAVLFAVWTA